MGVEISWFDGLYSTTGRGKHQRNWIGDPRNPLTDRPADFSSRSPDPEPPQLSHLCAFFTQPLENRCAGAPVNPCPHDSRFAAPRPSHATKLELQRFFWTRIRSPATCPQMADPLQSIPCRQGQDSRVDLIHCTPRSFYFFHLS
ncbi:MAG TPA: hypothetical protein VJR58_04545 [Vineibacter sp.]|nr:hypothetical protein [Vineibacter sp.]